MDPYERLAAINESMISRGIRAVGNAIAAPIRRAKKARQRKRNIAGFEQQLRDSGVLDKLNSLEDSFDPSKNPNEKMDKEFDAARQALTDAGISHTGLPAVGSMTREKNIIKIKKQEDMRKAREVMQDFPNTQIKRS